MIPIDLLLAWIAGFAIGAAVVGHWLIDERREFQSELSDRRHRIEDLTLAVIALRDLCQKYGAGDEARVALEDTIGTGERNG